MNDASVQAAYADNAERYIELFGSPESVHDDDLALIARHVGTRSGTVLDVGCGPGHLTEHLRRSGTDAVGVELTPAFVDHARAAWPRSVFVTASLDRLPLAAASVNGVLAWYSLIHRSPADLEVALLELRRVMATAAPLVIGCFDGVAIERFDHAVVTAYRWPLDELALCVERCGFVEIERHQRPGVEVAGQRPHAALVAVAG